MWRTKQMWELGDEFAESLALRDREYYLDILRGKKPPEGYDVSALFTRVEAWEQMALMGLIRQSADGLREPWHYHQPDQRGQIWYFALLAQSIWDSHSRRFGEACERGALSALWMPFRALSAYASLLALALQHLAGRPVALMRPLRLIVAYTT